jgi:predicted ATPase
VLADRVGTDLERLGVMWEEVAFRVVRCDLQVAIATAGQALDIALAHSDPALLAPAHHWMGAPLTQSGEFARARSFLEQATSLYDRAYHGRHVAMFGADFGVLARVFDVHALWHLGYPDQATAVSEQALALAGEVAHPFCRAIALVYDATFRQFQRECLTTEREAATLLAISSEYGFTYYHAWGTILHGWAVAMQGNARRGIKELQNGIAAMCATGTEGRRSYFLSLLAEAHGANHEACEGLAVIADALTLSETNGERWKDAELHRLRGELLLGQDATESEAERSFRRAIDVARRQEAKMLELRAAVSLARLQRRQGRCSEARETLTTVYEWFTEGFGSHDLIEAGTLLSDPS